MRSLHTAFAVMLSLSTACSSTVAPGTADVPSVTDVPAATDVPSVTDVPATSDVPAMRDAPVGRVPRQHRATRTACTSARPASNCDLGMSGAPSTCRADGECTTGTNGRCVGNPHDGCRCSYDTCVDDTGCTTGGPCACRHATRGAAGANVCLPGNCQVDADCRSGGYCSPTYGSCGDYSGVVGYRCHTPRDECVDDEDCVGGDAGFLGQRPYCMFAQEVGHWRCSNSACAG